MNYVDAALLNLAEYFSHRFQLLTGRTNVWLALQLTNLNIVFYFVWAFTYFWNRGLVLRIVIGLFCIGLLYIMTQTIFKVSIEAYEQSAYQRVAKGYRNPRRIRDAPLRISFLTLTIVLGYPLFLLLGHPEILANQRLSPRVAMLMYLLIVLTTAVLYLLACDPLPPCTGKVTEWLRGLAGRRVAAEEPQEQESASRSIKGA
jgi:hypothetical protein